jgi:hypothetical protein
VRRFVDVEDACEGSYAKNGHVSNDFEKQMCVQDSVVFKKNLFVCLEDNILKCIMINPNKKQNVSEIWTFEIRKLKIKAKMKKSLLI